MAFRDYRRPLETVTDFKYLGQDLIKSDDNCSTVVDNIQKARSRWVHFSRILGREGADPWTLVWFRYLGGDP